SPDSFWSLAFSPDGKTLAVASSSSCAVRFWDINTGTETRRDDGHDNAVSLLRFSPDDKKLLSIGCDKKLVDWDIASRRPLTQMSIESPALTDPGRLWSVGDISPDGRVLAIVSFKELAKAKNELDWPDSVIHLWDTVKGKELRVLRGERLVGSPVKFS